MDSQQLPLLYLVNYSEWNPNMCAYLNRKCLYEFSIGAIIDPDSYEEKCDWLSDNDRAYRTMCLTIHPTMHYLPDSTEYPFDLWRNIDEALGM